MAVKWYRSLNWLETRFTAMEREPSGSLFFVFIRESVAISQQCGVCSAVLTLTQHMTKQKLGMVGPTVTIALDDEHVSRLIDAMEGVHQPFCYYGMEDVDDRFHRHLLERLQKASDRLQEKRS